VPSSNIVDSVRPGVAYVLDRYPALSETFILHEMLEMERQGQSILVFALDTPDDGASHAAVRELQSSVTYLSRQGRWVLASAILWRLRKSPWRLARAVALLARHCRQRSVLRWIAYAAYLARKTEVVSGDISYVHAHYAHDPTSVALALNLMSDVPYSFTAHAFDVHLTPRRELAFKMLRARFIVTCTDSNRRYLAELGGSDVSGRVHCIYHGIASQPFPCGRTERAGPPLILAVGRLVEKKGFTHLVRACRILADRGRQFVCRVIGEGPLHQALEREIHELALADRVHLEGASVHERILEAYGEATAACLPCVIAENGDRDGIPNVLLEAMAAGVPVVSTSISAIPELIAPEINGLLVPPGEPAALADALVRLLDDAELRQRLGAAGRNTVQQRFDLTRNVGELRSLMCSVRPC
jgi:glycosyltransferase involved in cell wall biosynthesis